MKSAVAILSLALAAISVASPVDNSPVERAASCITGCYKSPPTGCPSGWVSKVLYYKIFSQRRDIKYNS